MSFKFNPFTGNLDYVSRENNFSFDNIPLDTAIVIPLNQQMIVYGNIVIVGTLEINGKLITLDL